LSISASASDWVIFVFMSVFLIYKGGVDNKIE